MNNKQFDKFVNIVRSLNSVGYIIHSHVHYSDGSQTIYFQPNVPIETIGVHPVSMNKILNENMPVGMCITCLRLDNVQVHILGRKRKG